MKHPLDIQLDAKQIPSCCYHWNLLRIQKSLSSNWSYTNLTHCLKSSHHVILGGSDLILIYHISFHSLTKVLNSTCYSFNIISKQSHLLKDTFSYLPMINERYFREFLHSPWLVTIPSLQRLTLTLSTVLTAGCIFILFVCGATGKQLGCDYSEWAQEY